jgi:hypothetical protein
MEGNFAFSPMDILLPAGNPKGTAETVIELLEKTSHTAMTNITARAIIM